MFPEFHSMFISLFILQTLEREHLSYDQSLQTLKDATNSVISVASKQDGLELSTQLESIIISYNSVCRDLLGIQCKALTPVNMICLDIGTRYDSSVLLWERFISMSLATRHWIEAATTETVEISASTAPVEDLLHQIKVRIFVVYQFHYENNSPKLISLFKANYFCKCIGRN